MVNHGDLMDHCDLGGTWWSKTGNHRVLGGPWWPWFDHGPLWWTIGALILINYVNLVDHGDHGGPWWPWWTMGIISPSHAKHATLIDTDVSAGRGTNCTCTSQELCRRSCASLFSWWFSFTFPNVSKHFRGVMSANLFNRQHTCEVVLWWECTTNFGEVCACDTLIFSEFRQIHEVYRGSKFGIVKGTVHSVIHTITGAIEKMSKTYLWLPKPNWLPILSYNFQRRAGFPGTFGSIDGCHIPIKAPTLQHEDYNNQKFTHSIILQGFCDDQGLFIDCYAGIAGSAHDARVLIYSKLFTCLERIWHWLRIIDFIWSVTRHILWSYGCWFHTKTTVVSPINNWDTIENTLKQGLWLRLPLAILEDAFQCLKYIDASQQTFCGVSAVGPALANIGAAASTPQNVCWVGSSWRHVFCIIPANFMMTGLHQMMNMSMITIMMTLVILPRETM